MLEAVEQCLPRVGAKGVTVTRVKGYGEYADFFAHDWQVAHVRVEVFTEAHKVDAIVTALMAAACSGDAGDGIVAVLPVEAVYRIRSCCPVAAGEL